MKTTNYTPAITKITDKLEDLHVDHKVKGNLILLEYSMDDLQYMGIDVYALLDMGDISHLFGADWESPSVITIYEE